MRNVFKRILKKAAKDYTDSTDAAFSSGRANESNNVEAGMVDEGVIAESEDKGMMVKKAKMNNIIVSSV